MQRLLFVGLVILSSAASFSQALAQDKRFSFKAQIVDPNVGVGYAVTVADLNQDRDGKEEILAAAYEGIFLFKKAPNGTWGRQQLGEGDPEKRGAGEIKVGRLPGGKRYIATVEPWHGHQAVVYTPPDKTGQLWKRQALIENHKGGHAVWTADLTGTGMDSLVVGFRGVPEGSVDDGIVYLLHPLDKAGVKWEKQILDAKGLGSEDVICADLNDDGKRDIIGVGRSTKNVKIYWNGGK